MSGWRYDRAKLVSKCFITTIDSSTYGYIERICSRDDDSIRWPLPDLCLTLIRGVCGSIEVIVYSNGLLYHLNILTCVI